MFKHLTNWVMSFLTQMSGTSPQGPERKKKKNVQGVLALQCQIYLG